MRVSLALLFLVLLLASLTARFWAGDRAIQSAGPNHLAADSQRVFLFAAGTIYHLSSSGELLAQYPAEVTGLTDVPIDLRITGDNRLLIAGQQPARIRSCDTDTWDCRDIDFGAREKPKRQFKLLYEPRRRGILLTDARGDSLWGLRGPDFEVARLLPDNTLAGPNDLALDSQGHLWIADTDHRRIVEFVPTADGDYETGREHSAVNELTRGERYYPIMLALGSDGNWWVTQATEFSDRFADLVLYDPDEGAVKQITLPGGVFATDVAASGDDILVTDLERFAVYRVDTGSHEVSIFGDNQFTAAMLRLEQDHARYGRISWLAMAGVIVFGVLMVVTAVIATPKNRRWTPAAVSFDLETIAAKTQVQPVPHVRGIYWLKRNPVIDRSLKWLEILGASIIILTLAGGLALYGWMRLQMGENPGENSQIKINELGYILLISGLLMLAVIPLVRQSMKVMKRKLGTDGKQVYIGLNDGREIAVPATELFFTNRALIYRQYALPLHTGRKQNLYEEGEIETWIVPFLQQAEQLSPFEGLKHQWKHRDDLLGWSLVSGVVLGLLLILVTQLSL